MLIAWFCPFAHPTSDHTYSTSDRTARFSALTDTMKLIHTYNNRQYTSEGDIQMFPSYKEIYIPLLKELISRGGKAKNSELYESLADLFELSDEERNIYLFDKNGKKTERKWNNMIRWSRRHLVNRGMIIKLSGGLWSITDSGKELINEVSNEREKYITPQLFVENQQQSAEIGEQGEKFVLEHERKFLSKHGQIDLVNKVCWIAKENIAAGYDILSFDLQGNEKYIEVKTSQSDTLGFYITDNEVKTAQKYGLSYWIYKVINISVSPEIVLKIQDPAQKIRENKLMLKPTAYQVIIGEDL